MRVLGLIVVAVALLAAAPVQIPEGTSLVVRLTTPVASNTSKVNDRVEAVVISPIAGLVLNGRVKAVKEAKGDERAYLEIEFDGAQLTEVDNARESVDKSGRIVGIAASESLAAQMDRGLEQLRERYANVAGVLQAAKIIFINDVDPEIQYPAGVEMTVRLTKPLPPDSARSARPAEPPDPYLVHLIRQLPLRTQAERPALPSDWTNLVFVGGSQNIEEAFKAAGWTPAAQMNGASVFETARAIIESRGYREAPVSKLRLEGRLPDLVFQKMNNTFAKRHHLRIWRLQQKWRDQEVWIGAATHDNGIAFASDERTFFHTIDPDIDKERQKVVDDLTFTGFVKQVAIISRPDIPTESTNATGGRMVTDGKIVVLQVR